MIGKSKKLLSSLLALAMVLGLFAAMPMTALAATGAVTIDVSLLGGADADNSAAAATESQWFYSDAQKTLFLTEPSGNYTLTGTNNNIKMILQNSATNASVTLDGANITYSATNTDPAFSIYGTCTLTLTGANSITASNHQGLYVSDAAIACTIGGTGSMTVKGATWGIALGAVTLAIADTASVTAVGGVVYPAINTSGTVQIRDTASLTVNNTAGGALTRDFAAAPGSAYIWKLTGNATTLGNLTDNPISVTVAAGQSGTVARASNPYIDVQPVNRSIYVGGSTNFSVTAAGNPALDYSWLVSTDGFLWNTIIDGGVYSGATTATLTLTNVPLSYSGYQYYCEVENTVGSVSSNSVTLTVTNAPSGGGGGWIPSAPTKPTVPEAPKPAFPVSGTVVGKRITVYKLETLKTTLFRLNKGDAFTVLGIANNGRTFRIEKEGREGFVAYKDIGITFDTPIKATALKKAHAYNKLDNGKLKRIGHYTKDQVLWIHGISGKYLINKQPNATYYLDAAQWRLWLPQ